MAKKDETIEIRWHGRGGQGAVTSAELVALAAIEEGEFAQAFPSFGPERRGAPVLVFNRINNLKPIRARVSITHPDISIVLDPGLLYITDVTSGLKQDGTLVINTTKTIADIKSELSGPWKLAVVNATTIARDILGVPIVNTTMLGALVKATGIIELESLTEPVKERFGARAKANIDACRRAHEETQIGGLSVVAQNHARQPKQKSCPHGENYYLVVLLLKQEVPSNIVPGIGNHNVLCGTIRDASNVGFAFSFARRDALGKTKMATSKPICIIVRDVAFVPVSAGQKL